MVAAPSDSWEQQLGTAACSRVEVLELAVAALRQHVADTSARSPREDRRPEEGEDEPCMFGTQ